MALPPPGGTASSLAQLAGNALGGSMSIGGGLSASNQNAFGTLAQQRMIAQRLAWTPDVPFRQYTRRTGKPRPWTHPHLRNAIPNGRRYGYVEGYRAWMADTNRMLVMSFNRLPWAPGMGLGAIDGPEGGDGPGVFAWKDEDTLLRETVGFGGTIIGRVALWGTVLECEKGFVAEWAYPLAFYRIWPAIEKFAQTYNAHLEDLPEWAEQWIKDRAEHKRKMQQVLNQMRSHALQQLGHQPAMAQPATYRTITKAELKKLYPSPPRFQRLKEEIKRLWHQLRKMW